MHGAHKIGEYWSKIPTYEHRAKCTHCNADNESLEHILINCPNNTSSLIWSLAKRTWPLKFGNWPRISIGTVLGCGNINLPPLTRQNNPPDNQPANNSQKGASRLLKILISESAYLIWTMRCDRTGTI
ncbi:uncharacterized protein EDB93DRAFT_1085318 [Suillus bovinus]|uniref:uncharacterized protein n=1 Tax=Suillus bovinus TaxID=48563 RepID=UPI001B886FA3|nr:uncharacterized protein EDB93DRAFT_1085318 [Suillus bovinus]KAG2147797.1 hypothetical protein EDB93DRAFT_1085318 [Suillus bovinus]